MRKRKSAKGGRQPVEPVQDAQESLLTSEKAAAAAFSLAEPRGYYHVQVDAFLEMVVTTLQALESEIDSLRHQVYEKDTENDQLRYEKQSLKAQIEIFRVEGSPMVDGAGNYLTESQVSAAAAESAFLASEVANLREENQRILDEKQALWDEVQYLRSLPARQPEPEWTPEPNPAAPSDGNWEYPADSQFENHSTGYVNDGYVDYDSQDSSNESGYGESGYADEYSDTGYQDDQPVYEVDAAASNWTVTDGRMHAFEDAERVEQEWDEVLQQWVDIPQFSNEFGTPDHDEFVDVNQFEDEPARPQPVQHGAPLPPPPPPASRRRPPVPAGSGVKRRPPVPVSARRAPTAPEAPARHTPAPVPPPAHATSSSSPIFHVPEDAWEMGTTHLADGED